MRLLYITRKYPPSVGGMQKINYDLAAELRKTTDIALIALGKSQFHLLWFIPWALLQGMFRSYDVIHLGDGLLAPIGWMLSMLKGRPFTVTVCGLEISYENRLYRRLVIPFIRRADRIICISENTLSLCISNGCEAGRCLVVPCGVSIVQRSLTDRKSARDQIIAKYEINNADLILLSVGRLVKRKGVAWFLMNVQPSLQRTTLIIAGDGPEREKIERLAQSMKNVRIIGGVDDDLLQKLYRGCDAFIMPNIHVEGDTEGFGIVLLEAGINGLFPYASRIDGIPEAVKDGKNGRLLESGNAGEWTRELSWCEANKVMLREMGEQARDYVARNYSWTDIAGKFRDVWERVG